MSSATISHTVLILFVLAWVVFMFLMTRGQADQKTNHEEMLVLREQRRLAEERRLKDEQAAADKAALISGDDVKEVEAAAKAKLLPSPVPAPRG